MPRRLPVVRITQQSLKIYVGRARADDILNDAIIDEWDPGKGWDLANQGYQRAPEAKHYRRIGRFLQQEGDPLLPTAALLSAREPELGILKSEPVQGPLGHLIIPDGRYLVIVDYQHRWRGLSYAINELGVTDLNKFEIPVVILANASRQEEMRQFYLVNSKQKRVNTDLALTLLQAMSSTNTEEALHNLVGPGFHYRIRGVRLVVRLAELASGPWANRIQEPNMNPDSMRIATLKSFVDSLRSLLSSRSRASQLTDDEFMVLLNAIGGV
jgi:DGQHR domain-containing protein